MNDDNQVLAWPRVGAEDMAGLESSARSTHTNRPVEVTLTILEGRWRPLIVWHLFWGARPFCDLLRAAEGITKKTLRHELAEMERHGLIRKDVRQGSLPKVEYVLTPFGETLKPLVGAMYEWGLCYMRNTRKGAPLPTARATADTRPTIAVRR
jgi:DNA-binding HxlR family transcriptional regulator